MARNNSFVDSPRDLIRLIIGLLFGSGIGGLAIGMIQGVPDARPWGLAVFILCLITAIFLFYWGERIIDKREQRRLERLGAAYTRVLNTTGQRLAGSVETTPDILEWLATYLEEESEQPLGEAPEVEWVQVFKTSTEATIKEWRLLAQTSSREGYFPPESIPQEIS